MTTTRPLPRVTLTRLSDGDSVSFWGPDAMDRAHDAMDAKTAEAGGYDLSVSDDRCEICGEIFSAEARDEEDGSCPLCGEGGEPS